MARFGPDTGSLQVHTYREGVAAKVGHDLIIEVTEWSGSDDGGTLDGGTSLGSEAGGGANEGTSASTGADASGGAGAEQD